MKIFLITIFCLFVYTNFYSQADSTKLDAEKVNVFKSYEAQIQRTQQKEIAVDEPKTNEQTINYSYDINTKVDVDFLRQDPVIRPVSYEHEKDIIDDNKDGVIYGAYGNINTIKAGGAYQYYIEDWMEAGVQVDHHYNAAVQNLTQYSPGMSTTYGELYASYFLNQITKVGIEGHGTFNNREAFLISNINSDASIVNLPYRSVGGTINFSHINFEKLGLSIRSKFSYDSSHQDNATENHTQQDRLLFDNNVYKKISEDISAEVDFRLLHIGMSNDNLFETIITTDYIIRPLVRYKADRYSVKGGIELIRGGNDNFLFPIIDLNISELYSGISLKLFTDSNFNRSDLTYYNRNNPYAVFNVNELRPVYVQDYNLLLSRQFDKLTTSLQVGYSRFFNEVQYVNFTDSDVIQSSVFEIEYLNRNEINISPKISLNTNLIELELFSKYHHFLGHSSEDILYQPQFEFGLKAEENLFNNRLSFTQQITYTSVRFGRDTNGFISQLDPLVDISMTFDYQISNAFTFFGEAYNILGTSYEVWDGIDNYGRHFWGGLRFKF